MRLRTCNNRRRARERRDNWRAPLDRVWARLDAAWLIDTLTGGGILSMPDDAQLRADLHAYGLAAWQDGQRIPPEDDLPEGLREHEGEIQFQCENCERWTQLPVDVAEYDPEGINLCGGSPRCCP